ncbi:MAG: hypothetical protein HZB55_14045, partial [Deltaproteobacteria bacterium]|nr:hypothetical protein [Deltaproteobacteria bacterium]
MLAKSLIRRVVLVISALVVPLAAQATHFPDGSLCYDCHAISKLKMVPGTHLIRASQRTTDLGITQVSPTMRCLFCHDTNAVSAALT